jgi:hypothetical protein
MATEPGDRDGEQWLDGLAGRPGEGAAHAQGQRLRQAIAPAQDGASAPPWREIERRAAVRLRGHRQPREHHRFAFPTPIHFGAGARRQVGPHLLEQGLKRPLIVTDRALARCRWWPSSAATWPACRWRCSTACSATRPARR